MTEAHIAELGRFIGERTGGALGEEWARLVLTKLVSGPEAVLDLRRAGVRLGAAVVIDTCETQGNAAELSVFAASPHESIFRELLDWGEARIAGGPRDYVDVTAWPGTEPPEGLMVARGYTIGHVMHEMLRPAGQGPPPAQDAVPPGCSWRQPDESLVRAYYETRAAAFAEVPGAFLTPFETFRNLVLDTDSLVELLVDGHGHVDGFVRVTLQPDHRGTIETIARHPHCRGRGLGRILVSRGLSLLWSHGARDIRLEVAATNDPAHDLYRAFGFHTRSSITVYRRPAR